MTMRSKVFSILSASLLVVTGLLVGGALRWLTLGWLAVVLGLVFLPQLRGRAPRDG
jgi:hypothetical protein